MIIEDKFLDALTISDPYQYLDLVRDKQPVFFAKSIDAFVVTRYEDAKQVLANTAVFSSLPRGGVNFMANFAPQYRYIYERAAVPPPLPALVVTDGEVHRRYRSHVEGFFTAVSVRALDEKIKIIVDDLIDQFIADGSVDLYRRFCLRLPLYVICDLLGLPRDQIELFQAAADASVRLAGGTGESEESRVELHQTTARFHKFLAGEIERVRRTPDEYLLSAIVHKPASDSKHLTDEELMSFVGSFNAGGNETTTNGLGNMFLTVIQQPLLMDALRLDRQLIPKFVEEVLRLQSPVTSLPRWVTVDTQLAGVAIPAGSVVIVNITACNRDPVRFKCPAEIDLDRPGLRNHMAFGLGPHYCLGSILARIELAVALGRVFDRTTELAIDGPVPTHGAKVIVRALQSLPVRFVAVTSH